MPTYTPHFARDMLRTAVTVIPATALWIVSENTWIAAGIGASAFLALEYGYPAWRDGRITMRHVTDAYAYVRSMIQSRSAKSV